MGKIHQLSDSVISKIAAGEVIGRPAYAVKELVENAIDAKASQIKIDLEESGLQKIVVTDNGEGMSKEDLQLCFKPHTTSKLTDEDDLIGIKSMGFRGEALASIASISNMILRSKREEDSSGSEITLTTGGIDSVSPVGMPTGTQIVIEQLFYPVPVRKKFLKTSTTELRLCLQLLTNLTLAYSNIRFIVTHNKKIVYDCPSTKNMQERITLLLGEHLSKNLIPITYKDSYISLSGFLAKPAITTTASSKQFLFINHRNVEDKLILLAIKEAYGNLLDSTSLPVFILFVDVPYEMVDVNVHPRKDSVTFIDKQGMFETVKNGIKETFEKNNISYSTISWKNEQAFEELSSRKGDTKSYAGNTLREQVLSTDIIRLTKTKDTKDVIQLHNLYLSFQTPIGIMYIDQHAAHERILYEDFKKAFIKTQHIATSIVLEKPGEFLVSITESLLLEEYSEVFIKLGFELKKLSETTFLIIKIPELFKERNIYTFLKELLDDLSQEKPTGDVDKKSHRMLAYLACRSAIKAGDALTTTEARNLLDLFEQTENNSSCPHGRPTTYQIPLKEMNKKFKR